MSNSHNTNSFVGLFLHSLYARSLTFELQVPNVDDHGYTFETHPPHDDFPASAMWSSSPNLGNLQMQIPPHGQMSMQQPRLTSSPIYSDYGFSTFDSPSDKLASPSYMLSTYSPHSTESNINMGPFPVQSRSPSSLSHASLMGSGSDQALSPLYPTSPGLPSPSTPGSTSHNILPSGSPNMLHLDPQIGSMNTNDADVSSHTQPDHKRYTHRQQQQMFRDVYNLPMADAGPFLPQLMYKPHTTSDRKRYVEEVMLEPPLHFVTEHPQQFGILLKDVLHSRTKRLVNREQVVFEGRGPSVSIRLEWPGYRQWSRQIPTKDFRSPPQPITLAKLAKNVAKCVQRFMSEAKTLPMDEDTTDPRWKIGNGPYDIKFEDLVLVSIHHVSLGSWQPQLRLAHPMRRTQQQHQQQQYLPPTPRTASNRSPASFQFPQLT